MLSSRGASHKSADDIGYSVMARSSGAGCGVESQGSRYTVGEGKLKLGD